MSGAVGTHCFVQRFCGAVAVCHSLMWQMRLQGVIQHATINNLAFGRNIEETQRVLQALKYVQVGATLPKLIKACSPSCRSDSEQAHGGQAMACALSAVIWGDTGGRASRTTAWRPLGHFSVCRRTPTRCARQAGSREMRP
jgi:hypothetical protein